MRFRVEGFRVPVVLVVLVVCVCVCVRVMLGFRQPGCRL